MLEIQFDLSPNSYFLYSSNNRISYNNGQICELPSHSMGNENFFGGEIKMCRGQSDKVIMNLEGL